MPNQNLHVTFLGHVAIHQIRHALSGDGRVPLLQLLSELLSQQLSAATAVGTLEGQVCTVEAAVVQGQRLDGAWEPSRREKQWLFPIAGCPSIEEHKLKTCAM